MAEEGKKERKKKAGAEGRAVCLFVSAVVALGSHNPNDTRSQIGWVSGMTDRLQVVPRVGMRLQELLPGCAGIG